MGCNGIYPNDEQFAIEHTPLKRMDLPIQNGDFL